MVRFQFVSQFLNFLNFAGEDEDEDEKRLVGLRLAAPQAKIELLTMDGGDTVRGGLLHFRKVDAICAQLRKTSDRTGAQSDQCYFLGRIMSM